MSDAKHVSPPSNIAEASVPTWLGAGLIGIVLGVGGALIVVRAYESKKENEAVSEYSPAQVPSPPNPMPMMNPPMAGFGGGGGPRGKANLSSLVGKLELLTRETLHVELTPEQSAKIGEQLAKLDQSEKMTDETAQAELTAIEAILTSEQKATLDSIRLPFARPAASSPGGPSGPGASPPFLTMGGGMGGGPPDENPFRRESNQKPLRDLLSRINPASAAPAKEEAKVEDVK